MIAPLSPTIDQPLPCITEPKVMAPPAGTASYHSWVRENKQFLIEDSGFDVSIDEIPDTLFPFQKAIEQWALRRGRAAIFADTGLGKTRMQLIWAHFVAAHTRNNSPINKCAAGESGTASSILILAPLCVAQQTVAEGNKIGILVHFCRSQFDVLPGINITNYEMLHHFEPESFTGIVLDESSILKHSDSKTRTHVINSFINTPYRLSCTATPSPNDYMELGNQSQFLGVMSQTEMLAMFFTHDGGDTAKWRLKGHGKTKFFEWLSTWALFIRKPSDLGFSDEGYNLPPLNFIEHIIESDMDSNEYLVPELARTLTERRAAKKETIEERVAKVAEIVNSPSVIENNESFVVWCHLNRESELLAAAIPDGEEIRGSDSIDKKTMAAQRFLHGDSRILISKSSIFGWGMNWQHCHNIAFVGLDDSFESFYQAVRRCWRFGQTKPVNVHIVSSEKELSVLQNIKEKEKQFNELQNQMVEQMKDFMQKEIGSAGRERTEYRRDCVTSNDKNGSAIINANDDSLSMNDGDNDLSLAPPVYELHLGDCVDVLSEKPSDIIDYTIFSPPFASLYTYSNSDYDMGNVRDYEEFFNQFNFLVKELYRVTKPGRLLSFHCMNLPTTKSHHGYIGIFDFRGDLIKRFCTAGFIFHSEVCIWKDPVVAMQRTKALGLLYKQLKKDSAMSRQGIPDYLVTMRKPGENPDPITHSPKDLDLPLWQRYASPIWMDINQSRTLQYREARDSNDERHICCLQLDVIERAIHLWSNPNDLILSPFAGIGSEGHVALKMGRRFLGVELKESYWNIAKKNLDAAMVENRQETLFE